LARKYSRWRSFMNGSLSDGRYVLVFVNIPTVSLFSYGSWI
jgi:hypothetical protein